MLCMLWIFFLSDIQFKWEVEPFPNSLVSVCLVSEFPFVESDTCAGQAIASNDK